MFLTQHETSISIFFFKQAYQQQSRINKNQDEDGFKIKVPGLKALKLSTKNLGNDFIQKKKNTNQQPI